LGQVFPANHRYDVSTGKICVLSTKHITKLQNNKRFISTAYMLSRKPVKCKTSGT